MSYFSLPSRVARGDGFSSPLSGGASIRLEWVGNDEDGVTTKRPVGYVLTRAKTLGDSSGSLPKAIRVLRRASGPGSVFPFGSEGVDTVFTDLAGSIDKQNWVFGIQAIDEAGAVEPTYRRGLGNNKANVFFFQAFPNRGGPHLSISSGALGTFTAPGGDRDSAQYVFDHLINLHWEGDASSYGAGVGAYRWGVDVQDVDNDQDPGWRSGWSSAKKDADKLVFSDHSAPIHVIVIQARDTNGGITTAPIKLTLVEFVLDRDALLVDDEYESAFIGLAPTQSQHQAYMVKVISEALADLGRPAMDPERDVYSSFPDTTTQQEPRPVQLGDLAHYRSIVWDAGRPPNLSTLWTLTAVNKDAGPQHSNVLAIYLESGGNILFTGPNLAAQTSAVRSSGGGGQGGFQPPTTSPIGPNEGLEPGDNNFAFDYWHLPGLVEFPNEGDPSSATRDGLDNCRPSEFGRSHGFLGGYPPLQMDRDRWYRFVSHGQPTGPLGGEAISGLPNITGGLDVVEPLYTYGAAGGGVGPFASQLDGKVNCQLFKKSTLYPEREDWQYQVVYAPFRLYYMRPAGVSGMLTNVLYEFLSDKKWGASRVLLPVRTPRSGPSAAASDAVPRPVPAISRIAR